jgi:FKBP-type peptidyl-prolyl cis-trans isomerase
LPTKGQLVHVHFQGKLQDGSVFDSSLNKSPVKFTVGKKEVIVGWNDGVLTMKEGEVATFTIKPESAYGDIGL